MANEDEDEKTFLTAEEQFWETLGTEGKPLSVAQLAKFALERPVTHEDVQYVISLYPYLDICNADVREPPADSVKATHITSGSGWVIHDRGDRLTAGPGRLNFGAYQIGSKLTDIDEDDESGGTGVPEGSWVSPEGTIVKQFYDTALDMIAIAKARWPAAEILGGYRAMQRAAWMASKDSNFSLNYGPSAMDMAVYQAIQSNGGVFAVSKRTLKPK